MQTSPSSASQRRFQSILSGVGERFRRASDGISRHPRGSLLSLAMATVILVVVLHRSQELTPSGPNLARGEFSAASDGSAFLLSEPLAIKKGATYLVILQGAIEGPLFVKMVDAEGGSLSPTRTIRQEPGRTDAPFWRTVLARRTSDHAWLSIAYEGTAQPVIQKVSVRMLDAGSLSRRWVAITVFSVCVLLGCLIHCRHPPARALLLGLGYLLFLLPWQSPGNFAFTSDNKYYIPTALSLIEQGDWALDEYGGPNPEPFLVKDYRLKKDVRERFVNAYPFGTSLVVMPLAWVGNWLHDEVPDSLERSRLISIFVARLLSAATVALLFLFIERLSGRITLGLVIALAFGLCTPHLSTHGGLWSHTCTAFLSVLAMGLLIWRDGRHAAWSALPLAIGFACRPTMAIPGLILGVGLLLQNRKVFLRFALLSAILGLAFVLLSLHLWGSILPPYYTNHIALQKNGPEAFFGTLFSPNRGLFVYCPLMLFALWGGVLAWQKNEKHAWLLRLCALIFLAEWIMASRNFQWWGGHSYGPRLLAGALVFAMPLLVPVWDRALCSGPNLRRLMAAAALLACAWGFWVQWRGLSGPDVYYWNARPDIDQNTGRLWSWDDWQIPSDYEDLHEKPKAPTQK